MAPQRLSQRFAGGAGNHARRGQGRGKKAVQACALSGTAEMRSPTAFMTAIKVLSVGLPLQKQAATSLQAGPPRAAHNLLVPL